MGVACEAFVLKYSDMILRGLPIAMGIAGCVVSADTLAASSRLQVFPFPQTVRYTHHNDDFTVRVRVPGGRWQDLYEYSVKVDLDKSQDASMVYFNFDGPVEVAVAVGNGTPHAVRVRPEATGIKAKLIGTTAYFTLAEPRNISVEFDGDHLHNLHLFSHAVRADMPKHPTLDSYAILAAHNPDLTQPVVYFGPGVYTPPDGEGGAYHIGSNTTVYVDGSALILGTFEVLDAENVKIISDGMFEGQKGLLRVSNSKNVTIDGPIIYKPLHGTARCDTSQNVQFLNIRTIGAGQWSDGIGNFACQDVIIADSFVRTSDDSVTIYNHRWGFWGSSHNITVRDSVLWADVAHAVFIGMHGNTPSAAHPEPETIDKVLVKNIDILDVDEDEPEYEGALGISAGDDNFVQDVTFEDIRVDRIEEGKLFNFHVGFNAKYNTSPGRGIENITLRNVTFTGRGSPSPSVVFGYDDKRMAKDITLDNVVVDGKRLTKGANLLEQGPFVSGVKFAPAATYGRPH